MVTKQAGFTLIECLLYLILFAIFTVTLSSFMVRVLDNAVAKNQRSEGITLLWSISRLLARDIERVPCKLHVWQGTASNRISWNEPEVCSWYVAAGSLWRQQGLLPVKVADGIFLDHGELDVTKGLVRGVSFVLRKGSDRLTYYVPLLGSLLCTSSLSL